MTRFWNKIIWLWRMDIKRRIKED